MTWINPIPYELHPTADPESFRTMPAMATGLPLPPHPGAFGVKRRFHTHEGTDLYCPQGTPVRAVEAGTIVAIKPFTGPHAGASVSHWRDTWAIFVSGASGIVVYGEVAAHTKVGQKVVSGELLGVVIRVLRHDKGRPMSMLHLELRVPGNTDDIEWLDHANRPAALLDPTPFLLESVSMAA